MKNNMLCKTLLLAGLTAAMLTGCGKSGIPAETEVPAAAREQELSEAKQDIIEVVQADTGAETAAAKTSAVGGAEAKSESSSGMTMMGGNDMDDPVLIEQSAEALKKYLGVSVDTSQYEISVTFFEAVDEEDEASYFVFFEAPANRPLLLPEENIGPDGFPLPEIYRQLTPEYSISFSESKEITSLQSMYNQADRTAPISMEEVKSLAKDFVLAHKMIADGKLNIMGSGYGSNIAMVLYENGKDGVVQVQVNPLSGKIEGFSYMTKSRAQLLMNPVEEGFGIG